MSVIAIALENAKDRELMSAVLAETHTVEEVGPDGALPQEFDLCILDARVLPRVADQIRAKKEEQPVFLPFLLAISRQDARMITAHLWESVDEMVPVPVCKRELVARIEVLLRTRRLSVDLRRSNEELQQFAYIASHDLLEPLRVISGYLELLKLRYIGRLDKDADEFINHAVDGAQRLQDMINGLFMISRVGTHGNPFVRVDCEETLRIVLSNLEVMIRDNGAEITHDPLPTLRADPSQLVQLLQNLIANAVKYRCAEPPRILVSARREGGNWLFCVRDNGIGIDPAHGDRIFAAFQRLHGREDHPGGGIGLATCKKIVERHGGRIWFESEPGKGSTFYFTIPDRRGEDQ